MHMCIYIYIYICICVQLVERFNTIFNIKHHIVLGILLDVKYIGPVHIIQYYVDA